MKTKLGENLYILGKYLDQPALVKGLSKAVPSIALTGAAAQTAVDTYSAPKECKKKIFIRDVLALSGALVGAFAAIKGFKIGAKHFKGIEDHSELISSKIDGVLTLLNKDSASASSVKKIKDEKYVSFKQMKELFNSLKEKINEVIPDSHAETAKEIFKKLGHLSFIGALPVIGGVAGGVAADKINGANIAKTSKNKIKEGFYQYLANIALCNIGAGAALAVMDKLKIKSNGVRLAGMLTGIASVGIVFGGTIANFIGKNIINPLLEGPVQCPEKGRRHRHQRHNMFKNINSERKPELLDVGLHVDDVASVGFLAGIKWVAPILPVLYAISGYRAGIGYRNGEAMQTLPVCNTGNSLNQICPNFNGKMKEIYEQFKIQN